MIPVKRPLLVLLSGGMILSCFQACSAFILAALASGPIPLSGSGLVLLTAALLTGLHYGRTWRRFGVVTIHASGLLAAAFLLCHRTFAVHSPFWHFNWIPQLFSMDRTLTEWLAFWFSMLCGVPLLWVCGVRLITKPPEPETISHRFDAGLAWLLGMLLIKLLVAVKGGDLPVAHSSIRAIITFVALGICSMGIVRIRSSPASGGAVYTRRAGIVLSFGTVALIAGGSLYLLFSSELQVMAQWGAHLIGVAAAPLGSVVVSLIRFVFAHARWRQDFQGGNASPGKSFGPEAGDTGLFAPIAAYVVSGLILIVALAVVGVTVVYLYRWLAARTAEAERSPGLISFLLSVVQAIGVLLRSAMVRLSARSNSSHEAIAAYRHLLGWGRRSGLRHEPFETPAEYGQRLADRFPGLEDAIKAIIREHEVMFYGCAVPEESQMVLARRALKNLRSPLLWPTRFRSLFIY
ncbi:MAG: DUF4129 domain-containing protein [Deltaproteobacteria bacterium]|nr:DUF4129 domain-containing protein [Deltaproteobacteria bacterium]